MAADPRASVLVPPLGSDAVWAAGWTPAEARLGVDQFKRGSGFRWAWQMAVDFISHPGIKAALEYRLANPCGLPWEVDGPMRAPGRFETEAARDLEKEHLARLRRSTLRDVAMLGMSVWHHPLVVDPDTMRTTVAPYVGAQLFDAREQAGDLAPWGVPYGGVQRWPLAAVGWTPYPLNGVVGYYAIAQGYKFIQLPRPGTTEGEWTVVGEGDQPHLDGAVCALDMEFTSGMLMRRARANLGISAGRASPYGVMPGTEPVNGEQGLLAQATLAGMGSEQIAALFPGGFKLDKFELVTTGAAEYFHGDLIDTLAMITLAIIGRAGGIFKLDAQFVAGQEMDVPEALTRRDVRVIERAGSGLMEMLARANRGEMRSYPRLKSNLPDADQAARVKAKQEAEKREAEKLVAFWAAFYAERDNGFDFPPTPEGQARLDLLAARCGVIAPRIPPEGLPPPLVKVPKPTVPITGEQGEALPAAPKPAPGSADASPAV